MSAAAPQIESLSLAELAWLKTQIRALPGGWRLDIVRDPAELSAVLLPEDGDRFAATFLIDRVAAGYRLTACHWDEVRPAGVFPTLAALLTVVAAASASAAPSQAVQVQPAQFSRLH